mgnify:CR=1 FL=1
MQVTMTVNGSSFTSDVESRTLLVQHLRDNLDLTGTHVGCDTSSCGACTIVVNGEAVKSCTLLAVQCDGAEITTIEGLSPDSTHLVQQAWIEVDVPQCGYCQSGQIMQAASLLETNPEPTDDDIDIVMGGNLCRCGTYPRIRAAVKTAAAKLQGV